MSVAYKLDSPKPATYTYADYISWPDDGKRWELIDGATYMMSAPRTNHQITLGALGALFYNHLRGKKCRAFLAPFDVRLPRKNEKRDNEITTVVQPDISIYCNPNGYDERGGKSAPELIVEILSPSSGRQDRIRKFICYAEAGVKEYWLADPVHETLEIYRLKKNKFVLIGTYTVGDTLPPPQAGCEDLTDFTPSVEAIFAENLNRPLYTDNEYPITTKENEHE